MVSKKSWERFKRDVEGLTKIGVEQQSWGRKSVHKDSNESFSRKRQRSTSDKHSVEVIDKYDDEDNEIKGFSSSDDDQPKVTCQPKNTSLLKSSLGRPVSTVKKRRCKVDGKYNASELHLNSPAAGFHRSVVQDFDRPSKSVGCYREQPVFCNFENSFTAVLPTLDLTAVESPNVVGRPETRNESEDISWSESDDEPTLNFIAESPGLSPPSKTPLPALKNTLIEEEIVSEIDEFDSDTEERDESILNTTNQEPSPSISPNTPTPTSPNNKETMECPPLDSSKKKKLKYLRSGLAEKLRKLVMRQKSEKSFWLHKLRQVKENVEDGGYSSTPVELGTVTLRVLSHHFDHSVYVMSCDVISQDVSFERKLPGQVTILLDSERRNQMDFKCNPLYLRIYPPWKIFDLPNCSTPVLLCITHCELVSNVSLDVENHSSHVDSRVSVNMEQDEQFKTKIVRTKLFVSSDAGNENAKERSNLNEWTQTDTHNANDKLVEQTTRATAAVPHSIMEAVGIQGQCVNNRINFIARVQRVYWRSTKMKKQTSLYGSSLVQSIIENSKILEQINIASLCLLVQDSRGLFSEISLPNDILLSRKDWQELLSKAQGAVVSFRGLQLMEHRKRKRRSDVFRIIDYLTENNSTTDNQGIGKQDFCSTFFIDKSTVLDQLFEEEGASFYLPFRYLTIDDLQLGNTTNCKRASLYGKLLYFTCKKNPRYDIDQLRLFISGILTSDGSLASDISEETVSDRVIQVCSSNQSSSVGWNETTLIVGQLMCIQDVVFDKAFSATCKFPSPTIDFEPISHQYCLEGIIQILKGKMTFSSTKIYYKIVENGQNYKKYFKNQNGNPSLLIADIFSFINIVIPQSTLLSSSPPSHVHDLCSKMTSVVVDDEKYSNLKALPHTVLPNLNFQSRSNNLVHFEGVIFDVDQANAFCWFTCNECGSDDISELPDNALYICNSCGLDVSRPVTNTHLEVYLRSDNQPPLYVKAKLLQSTISRLLPVSDAGTDELSQGYDVQCVLHKRLEPTSWYVLKKFDEDSGEDKKICFKLEEVDTSNWS